MGNERGLVLAVLIVAVITASAFGQKVKIVYDKGVDFSKYKTYTWAKLDHPLETPQLYKTAVATIDQDLNAKVDANGDLTLSASGGIDGYNMPPSPNMNTDMWYGDTGAPILLVPLLAQGSLILHAKRNSLRFLRRRLEDR